jgi:hypothetical protein
MGAKRNNRLLMGKPKLGKSSCRWEDNIKMDGKEIGWGGICGLDLSGLGWEQVAEFHVVFTMHLVN